MKGVHGKVGLRPILVLIALALAGCGGGGDSTSPTFDLSGAWSGTETFTSGPSGSTSFRLTLVQSGSSVTGSYSNGRGDQGTVNGTVSGTRFSGTARSSVLGITCNVNGDVSSDGTTLTANVACSDGTGAIITVRRV